MPEESLKAYIDEELLTAGPFEAMKLAVNAYQCERQRYHEASLSGLPEPTLSAISRFLSTVGIVAKRFAVGVRSLASTEASQALDALDELHALCHADLRLTQRALLIGHQQAAIELGIAATEMARVASIRCMELMQLIRPWRGNPRTLAFLQRVSRCYLFGFDAECVILCRSVLDVEFQAAVSESDCQRFARDPRKCFFSLDDRIWAATKLRLIDYPTAERARCLKKAANDLIHYAPSLKSDAIEAISGTLDLIVALNPTPAK